MTVTAFHREDAQNARPQCLQRWGCVYSLVRFGDAVFLEDMRIVPFNAMRVGERPGSRREKTNPSVAAPLLMALTDALDGRGGDGADWEAHPEDCEDESGC